MSSFVSLIPFTGEGGWLGVSEGSSDLGACDCSCAGADSEGDPSVFCKGGTTSLLFDTEGSPDVNGSFSIS